MSYTISAVNKITLNEQDAVSAVIQNVAIILTTAKSTVPLYREFGVSMDYLDKPLPVAAPMFRAEIKEAVEKFEPRCEVVAISFTQDPSKPGILFPTVEVNIISE